MIAVAILASLASASTSFSTLRDADVTVAARLFAQAFIGVLPSALALVLLLGNPPAGAALDLAIGTSVASVLRRMFSFSRYVLMAYGMASSFAVWMTQMAFFTLADIAIVAIALMVRRRVDTGHPGRLAAMILGFLVWEWLVQMTVMLSY